MQCLVRAEISFNIETHYFMMYDSVAVQASVQVMDCQWSDSVSGLYAPEVSECYKQAGNLWIALLSPLLSTDPSEASLLYHGMKIFPWAVLFPLGISNMNSILGFFHIKASFFWQRPLYWSASIKGQQCEGSLK